MFFDRLFGSRNLIHVHTEKQQYYSGEVVQGTISLSIVEATHIDAVYVKIKGFQESAFEETESVSSTRVDSNGEKRNESKLVTVLRQQKSVFFRRKYCIHAYKATLHNGNFLFPFQFQLEHGLPGTFTISSQSSGFNSFPKGIVRYSVKAEVAVPGMFKPNIKSTQDILICEPLDRALMSSDTYKEAKVTFLCCIPKGHVSVAANIDKNAYAPGEVVNVRLIVDNTQSHVALDGLSLKLQQSLKLSAQNHTYQRDETVARGRSQAVPVGERTDRIIQLVIPQQTEPSTRASLVRCDYTLKIDMIVPWSPNVTLKQPVQIYAPVQQTYVMAPAMPPDWNPTLMPAVNLAEAVYQSY